MRMQEYLISEIYHDYRLDEKTHVINHKINLYGKCRKKYDTVLQLWEKVISKLEIAGKWLSGYRVCLQWMQEMQVCSLSQEDPLEEAWQPTPVFLSGESHGQRSLVGYSSMGSQRIRKNWSDWAHMYEDLLPRSFINIILKGETLNPFPLNTGPRQGFLFSLLLFNITVKSFAEDSSKCYRKKEKK